MQLRGFQSVDYNSGIHKRGCKMLNWENDRRKRQPREFDPDALPRTGSWGDQKRWAQENGGLNRSSAPKNRNTVSQLSLTCHWVIQLSLYLKCIKSIDFHKKYPEHQTEIIENLRKLVKNLSSTNVRLEQSVAKDISEAKTILFKYQH